MVFHSHAFRLLSRIVQCEPKEFPFQSLVETPTVHGQFARWLAHGRLDQIQHERYHVPEDDLLSLLCRCAIISVTIERFIEN